MNHQSESNCNDPVGAGHFRLVLIENGSALLNLGLRRYSVVSPSILCFNENDNYYLECSDDWRQTVVDFTPAEINSSFTSGDIRSFRDNISSTARLDYDYLEMFIVRDSGFSGCINLGPSESARVKHLIKSYVSEAENKSDEYWPCRSRSYLLELVLLLFRIYRSNGRAETETIDDSLAGRVAHYIRSSFHEKISIEEICRHFLTNRTTLNVEMKKITGFSVIDYVNKTRIESAAFLLRDTGLPVSEVAFRSGFNDVAHFSRIFRKFMNTSPGNYRKTFAS